MERLRVGFDLVQVSGITSSLRQFGRAFEARLFTESELEYARSGAGQLAERLAARFAAKEAAIKALQLANEGVSWLDIEVRKRPDGDCELALHGKVAVLAGQMGVEQIALSLSHDGDYAGAFVTVLSRTQKNDQKIRFEKGRGMSTMDQFEAQIRAVLRKHGHLNKDVDSLDVTSDLYQCGMTSHASVNVMLALEGEFDIEFPDHMLKRNVFGSIQSMLAAVSELTAG